MESDTILTTESSEIIADSVKKGIEEIDKALGQLHHNGKIKTVNEEGREKLLKVYNSLGGLKRDIECLQSDLEKVCFKETCLLEVPERRATIKGTQNDRDSGYSSDLRLSMASNTSEQSSNRLSKVDNNDSNDLERKSSDEAELYNPSTSGSSSSFSDDMEDSLNKPEFFIKTVDSETSLHDISGKYEGINISDKETMPKVQVASADKINHSRTDLDIIKESNKEFCHEGPAGRVVTEDTNEPHTAPRQIEGMDENTVPKVINEDHSGVPEVLNNLSKRSSEEDNTRYAADDANLMGKKEG